MSTKETDSKNLNSNEELIKREEIPNSPFVIITTEEGSFGAMGKWRLTEVYETAREAIETMEQMTWNRIIQVVMLLIENQKQL